MTFNLIIIDKLIRFPKFGESMCLLFTLLSTYTQKSYVYPCDLPVSLWLQYVLNLCYNTFYIDLGNTNLETLYIMNRSPASGVTTMIVDKLFCLFLCKIIVHMIYYLVP